MEGEFLLVREPREGGDVVDDAVGEVGRGADEEDGVGVDEARDGGDLRLVGGGFAGDEVHFDLEVLACFAEGRVRGFGQDHFGLGHAALGVGFVARGEAGHEDGFGAAAGGNAHGGFRSVEQR